MKWVTRERPRIDRIACPWLIARFIDKAPEFLFVPSQDVLSSAQKRFKKPDVRGRHPARTHALLLRYEIVEE